jgi:hypothetical protein
MRMRASSLALAQADGVDSDREDPQTPEFENKETVIDAIIALDDLFQAGKLPEEAYQQRRAELKARLKELISDD